MITKKYNYIETQRVRVIVDLEKPKNLAHPILWNHQGMYSIIPLAVLSNLKRIYDDNKLGVRSGSLAPQRLVSIYWHESAEISPDLAKLLLGY